MKKGALLPAPLSQFGGWRRLLFATKLYPVAITDDGNDDFIDVNLNGASGANSAWVITDQATGAILGTPATQPAGGFSLEGAPTGICDIWYLRYTGDIGVGTATNTIFANFDHDILVHINCFFI